MSYCTFLINLDRSPERLASADSQLAAAGIGYERIAAVDGTQLTRRDWSRYDERGALRHYGRTMAPGEVGCFLSHVEAVTRFLQSDADHALVLEDDLRIAADFAGLVGDLDEQLPQLRGWHVANLGNGPKKFATGIGRFRSESGEHTLCVAHHFPALTTALFWSREGARAFLEAGLPATAPVDQFLRDWCVSTGRGLAFLEPPVTTTGAESQIDYVDNLRRARRGVREAGYLLRKMRRSVVNNVKARTGMWAFRSGRRREPERMAR